MTSEGPKRVPRAPTRPERISRQPERTQAALHSFKVNLVTDTMAQEKISEIAPLSTTALKQDFHKILGRKTQAPGSPHAAPTSSAPAGKASNGKRTTWETAHDALLRAPSSPLSAS